MKLNDSWVTTCITTPPPPPKKKKQQQQNNNNKLPVKVAYNEVGYNEFRI